MMSSIEHLPKSRRITGEELAILGERGKGLGGRVERACRDKIGGPGG